MSLPTRGAAYTFHISLLNVNDTTQFLDSPTIEAGDVKVSKDGGAEVDVATLPTVANKQVTVSLSETEMEAGSVTVEFQDQTVPGEWLPVRCIIPTI